MKALAGTSAPEVILDFSVAGRKTASAESWQLSGNAWIRGKSCLFFYTNAEDRESSLRWSLPPVFLMVRLVSGSILSGKGKLLSV